MSERTRRSSQMSDGSHTEVASSLAPSTIDRGASRSHPHAYRSRQRHRGPGMTRRRLALCACGRYAVHEHDRSRYRTFQLRDDRPLGRRTDRSCAGRGDDHSSASCRDTGPGVAAQILPQGIEATDGSGLTHALWRQPAGRRGEGHAGPEGSQCRPRQEVRFPDHYPRISDLVVVPCPTEQASSPDCPGR
jgi:hypothetical protein